MLSLLTKPLYLGIIAALISSGVTSCTTHKLTKNYYKTQYDAQVSEIKRVEMERTERLREEAIAKEAQMQKAKTELELQNEKQRQENKALLGKYNTLLADGKRLRDPGTRENTVHCSGNTNSTSGTSATAGGAELSIQASEFLLSEAGRADEIMRQLNLCKAWVQQTQKK